MDFTLNPPTASVTWARPSGRERDINPDSAVATWRSTAGHDPGVGRKTPIIASRSEAAKHCLHDGRIAPRRAMDSQLRIPGSSDVSRRKLVPWLSCNAAGDTGENLAYAGVKDFPVGKRSIRFMYARMAGLQEASRNSAAAREPSSGEFCCSCSTRVRRI